MRNQSIMCAMCIPTRHCGFWVIQETHCSIIENLQLKSVISSSITRWVEKTMQNRMIAIEYKYYVSINYTEIDESPTFIAIQETRFYGMRQCGRDWEWMSDRICGFTSKRQTIRMNVVITKDVESFIGIRIDSNTGMWSCLRLELKSISIADNFFLSFKFLSVTARNYLYFVYVLDVKTTHPSAISTTNRDNVALSSCVDMLRQTE